MTATAEQIASIPLLRSLPPEALDRLAQIARTRDYEPGWTIVEEGHEGVGVFLLVEGEASVMQDGRYLTTLGPGSVIGEMAAIDHHLRSATVRATTPATCIGISRWDFLAELRESPDLVFQIMRTLSKRLRELDEQVTAV
jgi:CRP-like cAMP-binding protein